MPTAAKLVGGVCLGIVAYIACLVYNIHVDADLPPYDGLLIATALIGFVSGWMILGTSPGYGGFESIASGLRAVIGGFFVGCFLYGLMIVASSMAGGAFSDPMQAVISWLRISLNLMAQTFNFLDIWLILLLGGAIAGRFAGIANFRWS